MPKGKALYRQIKEKVRNIKEDSVLEFIKRPIITLCSNRELVVQGHISVEKYTEAEIVLKVDKMEIIMQGRGLTMCFYNADTVKLAGYITSMNFEGT